ncbi:TIGR03618 family F420-dependent PPOX class oxidoreductase [Amnibacterium sp. CER49]|uniref:TIGR03618 family F420-dependent PPOX class oxidoreductase n=1 Tax=Amnibacterium sp. CER49 TaxID=3039161 RepID=UPI00244A569B|nr:TIGR03618 family F420-dependent PPOX class oxidoreductase [Amnibacterium sp. CER49]MDH2445169.1 TIGR03618 family F420-dependent PPOX class oxidoreductase [Amnibacterium sp. CER49]
MPAELSPQVRDFLRLPNPAVMATVGTHGRPLSVATWYLLEDDDLVLLNLDGGRMRLQHLRDDPRVALTVLDGDDWGTHVSLQLDVTRIDDDADLADIDALATHYTGSAYPDRERPRVSVRAGIRRVHAWGRFA